MSSISNDINNVLDRHKVAKGVNEAKQSNTKVELCSLALIISSPKDRDIHGLVRDVDVSSIKLKGGKCFTR